MDDTNKQDAAKAEIEGAADEAKQAVKGAVESTKGAAKGVVDDVKTMAQDTKNYVATQFGDVRNEVTSQAKTTIDKGRSQVAGQVEGLASALTRAGEQLRNEDQPELANYSERAGEQIQNVASYLGERDLREVMRDVEGFARKNPLVFAGAAVALGLIAARFLKSSRPYEAQ